MNGTIVIPSINVIWVLVLILLAAALLMEHSYREILLVLVIILLIPVPLLTQSLQVNVIESTMPSVSSHIEPLRPLVAIPSQFETTRSPAPVKAIPEPVIAPPAPAKPPTVTQASANYGYNPKPKYPSIARSRGWEGTVRLQVHVSGDGDSEKVTVAQSSGYDVLDEAAVSAVESWRFVPAKRGDTPVAGTVMVPINFKLDN